jgi:molybdopterin-biosynthesis enzyme MoeA-like protein
LNIDVKNVIESSKAWFFHPGIPKEFAVLIVDQVKWRKCYRVLAAVRQMQQLIVPIKHLVAPLLDLREANHSSRGLMK